MPANIERAYVSCYVVADDYERGIKKCLSAFGADGIHVEEILQPISAMKAEDWEVHIGEQWPSQADRMPNQSEFEESMKSGGVVYGPFGAY